MAPVGHAEASGCTPRRSPRSGSVQESEKQPAKPAHHRTHAAAPGLQAKGCCRGLQQYRFWW